MFKALLTLLVFVAISLSADGCARERQTTEPATAPPSPPSIGGGGPASTVVPSDPEENFKNAVLQADLIVSGTITGQKYEVVTVVPQHSIVTVTGDNTTGTLEAYSDNTTPENTPTRYLL